jgi:1-acyl-sn-glycerol-3-phosphate acyltransferase
VVVKGIARRRIIFIVMQKPIHAFNIVYQVVRAFFDQVHNHLFYSKVTIVGKDKLPKGKPLLLAPNHQNALMDALAVLHALKGQLVFMARADIFQNGFAAKALRFIKILPIFRIRDGIKSLQNNDAVFEEAVGVLEAGKRLCILPEGNHFGQRRLRALKKGFARIAFMAEERNNFNLDIHIVPVGLDYSHYIHAGSQLLVEFGEAFALKPYLELYKENPQKAMAKLVADLRDRMVPQMLHIDTSENYDQVEAIKDIVISENRKLTCENDHLAVRQASQKIVDKVLDLQGSNAGSFSKLMDLAGTYLKEKEKNGFRHWIYRNDAVSLFGRFGVYLLLLLSSPVFIIGYLLHALPFHVPVVLSKNIKDPQFLSSIRYGIGLIMYTLLLIVYGIVLFLSIEGWYFALLALLAIPFIGKFAFDWYKAFRKNTILLKYWAQLRKGKLNEVRRVRKEILDLVK